MAACVNLKLQGMSSHELELLDIHTGLDDDILSWLN